MNLDFALILFILVLISGVCWVAHKVWQHPALDYVGSFFGVLLLVFVLRSFLYEPFQIPSGSMIPTLEVGDFILVNKFNYGVKLPILGTRIVPVGEPQRGDVVVFTPPNEKSAFIKRLVGLPGDHIRIENNRVYINDEPLDQEFLVSRSTPEGYSWQLWQETTGDTSHQIQVLVPPGPYGRYFENVVPPGHYFMMGDNRDQSSDSRAWGFVPEANIIGEAVAIWMNWRPWQIPSFDRVGGID